MHRITKIAPGEIEGESFRMIEAEFFQQTGKTIDSLILLNLQCSGAPYTQRVISLFLKLSVSRSEVLARELRQSGQGKISSPM